MVREHEHSGAKDREGIWLLDLPSMKSLESISRELMVHDKVLAKAAAAGKPLHFVLYDLMHSGRRAAQA